MCGCLNANNTLAGPAVHIATVFHQHNTMHKHTYTPTLYILHNHWCTPTPTRTPHHTHTYTHTHKHTSEHAHTLTPTHIHTIIGAHTHTHINTCHTSTHWCTPALTPTSTQSLVHAHAHTHSHTHTLEHAHTYTHTHNHTHTIIGARTGPQAHIHPHAHARTHGIVLRGTEGAPRTFYRASVALYGPPSTKASLCKHMYETHARRLFTFVTFVQMYKQTDTQTHMAGKQGMLRVGQNRI